MKTPYCDAVGNLEHILHLTVIMEWYKD